MILVMRSDNRDGLCYCTRSAYPIHRFVRICPEAPIEGTQAVESFVGANGNGVVCLLYLKWWMKEYDVDTLIVIRIDSTKDSEGITYERR